MEASHHLILLGGVLGLASIFAGLFSVRFGTPLLLVFLGLGMLAGEDGPGGIEFDDYAGAYLVGSVALAAILFEGGLKTERAMVRVALWPSIVLATLGVAITAAIIGALVVLLFQVHWGYALLIGAAVAPTDAAAVAVLLRISGIRLPERVGAVLEIESGLNDPMSVLLTLFLVAWLLTPAGLTIGDAALTFFAEMGGGAAIGLGGGYILLWLLRRLTMDASVSPVFALAGALTLFGGAQSVGASGFLAIYLAGVVVGNSDHEAIGRVERFFETFAWLAQISLFLMLGLLVTPHQLTPMIVPALVVAALLIFLARPLAVFACLLPFRFSPRQMAFVSWVGLRGAVPIYLTIIPILSGVQNAELLFATAFIIVIASLVIQGWTIGPAARLLRLTESEEAQAS
ncbi:MAG TPA: potassium/proton antiporter [Stellaceae bacterium]|nr:potassium/proton antiporter [Stellaceae bacterium]